MKLSSLSVVVTMNFTESELKKRLSVQLFQQLLMVDMRKLIKGVAVPHTNLIIKYDYICNEISTSLDYTPITSIQGNKFMLVDAQRLHEVINDLFGGVLYVLWEKRQMTWIFEQLTINIKSYLGKAFITINFSSTNNNKLLYC